MFGKLVIVFVFCFVVLVVVVRRKTKDIRRSKGGAKTVSFVLSDYIGGIERSKLDSRDT